MNTKLESMMIEATKDMPQGYYVPPQYFEKFAELVVKECLNIIEQNAGLGFEDPFDKGWNAAVESCHRRVTVQMGLKGLSDE